MKLLEQALLSIGIEMSADGIDRTRGFDLERKVFVELLGLKRIWNNGNSRFFFFIFNVYRTSSRAFLRNSE